MNTVVNIINTADHTTLHSRPHIMRGNCQNKQAYIRFIIIITTYVHNIYIGYNNYVSVIILKLAITVIALLSTIIRKLND